MEEVLKLYIFPNMRDRRSSIFFPAAPLVVAHENMLHSRRRGGGVPRDCSDAGGNFQLAAPDNFFGRVLHAFQSNIYAFRRHEAERVPGGEPARQQEAGQLRHQPAGQVHHPADG